MVKMKSFRFEADIPTIGHISELVEVKESESAGAMLELNKMAWLLKQFNCIATEEN